MQLSRLVDGDLTEAERDALIDALLTDPELAQRWQRYHALGDLLRDGTLGVDLVARVRAAIHAEAAQPGAGTVLPFAARLRPRGWLKPRGGVHARPAIGLALAASVALATVVGLRALVPEGAPMPPMVADTGASVHGPVASFADGVVPAGFGTTATGEAVGTALGDGLADGLGDAAAPARLRSRSASAPGHGVEPALRLPEYLERHRREVQTGMLVGGEPLGSGEPLH